MSQHRSLKSSSVALARRSRALACAVCALLGTAQLASGREVNALRFRQLTTADGLSQAAVYAIAQDSEGYMWFGSQEGLNRYDGRSFEVFSHDPSDPQSLASDHVWALLLSRDGHLWVGSDTGLDRYEPRGDRFEHYLGRTFGPNGTEAVRVRALYEAADNTIWIGTEQHGLLSLDPATRRTTVYDHDESDPTSLTSNRVTAIVGGAGGSFWVATDGGGLLERRPDGRFRAHRNVPAEPESLSEDRIRTLSRGTEGELWVGTYSGHLNRFDPASGGFERLVSEHSTGEPSRIRSILQDSSGSLWVARDLGLDEWSAEREYVRSYTHQLGDPYGLSDSRMISLYEDRGGVLWIGTWGGLNKASLTTGHFAHHYRNTDQRGELSSNVVTSFTQTPDGSLWVGTYGGGLDRFDQKRGRFESFSELSGPRAQLSDARVMSLLSDDDGTLWIGSFGTGLDRYEPRTGRVENYRHLESDSDSLSSNGVTSILRDRTDRLWIGTYGGGLDLLIDRRSGRFKHFQHSDEDSGSLSGNRVISILEARDGSLWVGVEGGGLNLFDETSQSFVRFQSQEVGDFEPESPYAIFEDAAETLWIGSQKGLRSWSKEDRSRLEPNFKRYNHSGALTHSIFGILGEDSGALWLSSNRGLVRFDPESGTVQKFDSSDGLQSEEFNSGAYFRTRDGRMLFGGPNGFNMFHPDQIRANSHIPPVVLRSFLRLNEEVDLEVPLAEIEQMEIDHDDRMITFEFAALDFTAPEKNQYRYRLVGFDSAWVVAGNLNRATYTNLNAGTYTFEVQASNADGRWNRAGRSVGLRVRPAPWHTVWAYALYVLAGLAALVFYGRSQAKTRRHAAELLHSNAHLQREVSDRQRAEHELHKLSLAVEQSPASVMITDHKGIIDYVNPKFERSTGYSLEEMRGQRFDTLQSGYGSKKTNEDMWQAVLAGEEWRGELHQRRKTGEVLWEHASVSPIFSKDGRITHIVAVNEDITVRKRYEERLLHQAHYDHLTELPNRTLALDRLEGALARCRRSKSIIAILFVDLDNFKIVNDTLGHHAGDELLRTTARRLEDTLREDDTVARLGGDEFLLILNDLPSSRVAEFSARKILQVFQEPFQISGREIFVTASIGLTIAPEDGDDPHTLMSNADAAMYKAKEHGRDAYRFFTPKMNEQALDRLRIENNLRQAIERDELQLNYQPIVETATGRMVGCEALLRWDNEELGKVSPARFIPIAEETGLVTSIGSWVIREVCRQMGQWKDLYDSDFHVEVNISSRQLRSGGLTKEIAKALELNNLPPRQLGLEVTEHALLEDAPRTAKTIRRLQELGVRLAVDDFGTGYSALNHLKRFRFDALKIDQTFIRDLLTETEDQDLTRAIIAMAKSLRLDVIAEGVETREHLEMLREFGCPHVQGFYFSKPLPPAEFEKLLTNADRRLAPAI